MDNQEYFQTYNRKKVLITGVGGTVGLALAKKIASYEPSVLVGLDNSESALFFAEQQIRGIFFPVLADIRDAGAVKKIVQGVDILFHVAALKNVPVCERNPLEVVRTNLLGLQNIIDSAVGADVGKIVFTSTDKAVNPTNVMGASKLMGEQLIRAANLESREQSFFSTRFGNVLGSQGSVVPIFSWQIANGGPVTITSNEMTRFVMTLDDAVEMLLGSVELASGGEVFVTKMKAISVMSLVEVMVDKLAPQHGIDPSDIKIEEIGARPGEKYFEELMTDEEVRRTLELEKYFVIKPALSDMYRIEDCQYPGVLDVSIAKPYTSDNESLLSNGELTSYMEEANLI